MADPAGTEEDPRPQSTAALSESMDSSLSRPFAGSTASIIPRTPAGAKNRQRSRSRSHRFESIMSVFGRNGEGEEGEEDIDGELVGDAPFSPGTASPGSRTGSRRTSDEHAPPFAGFRAFGSPTGQRHSSPFVSSPSRPGGSRGVSMEHSRPGSRRVSSEHYRPPSVRSMFSGEHATPGTRFSENPRASRAGSSRATTPEPTPSPSSSPTKLSQTPPRSGAASQQPRGSYRHSASPLNSSTADNLNMTGGFRGFGAAAEPPTPPSGDESGDGGSSDDDAESDSESAGAGAGGFMGFGCANNVKKARERKRRGTAPATPRAAGLDDDVPAPDTVPATPASPVTEEDLLQSSSHRRSAASLTLDDSTHTELNITITNKEEADAVFNSVVEQLGLGPGGPQPRRATQPAPAGRRTDSGRHVSFVEEEPLDLVREASHNTDPDKFVWHVDRHHRSDRQGTNSGSSAAAAAAAAGEPRPESGSDASRSSEDSEKKKQRRRKKKPFKPTVEYVNPYGAHKRSLSPSGERFMEVVDDFRTRSPPRRRTAGAAARSSGSPAGRSRRPSGSPDVGFVAPILKELRQMRSKSPRSVARQEMESCKGSPRRSKSPGRQMMMPPAPSHPAYSSAMMAMAGNEVSPARRKVALGGRYGSPTGPQRTSSPGAATRRSATPPRRHATTSPSRPTQASSAASSPPRRSGSPAGVPRSGSSRTQASASPRRSSSPGRPGPHTAVQASPRRPSCSPTRSYTSVHTAPRSVAVSAAARSSTPKREANLRKTAAVLSTMVSASPERDRESRWAPAPLKTSSAARSKELAAAAAAGEMDPAAGEPRVKSPRRQRAAAAAAAKTRTRSPGSSTLRTRSPISAHLLY